MSVSLRDHRRPAWTSGLARHANAGAARTPSFRAAFRDAPANAASAVCMCDR